MRKPLSPRRWWRLALAAPAALSLTVPAMILAQSPDARFVERTNQVEYSPAGSAQWQPAPADVALAAGDRLRTGPASAARVAFFDGTTTALGASAGLRVDRLDADPRQIKLSQVSGITQAQLRVPADGGAAYEVESPSLVVRATAATCPWVRVAADGTTLVRNYAPGASLAVEPQPVQDVIYMPVPVAGPNGPVPVPMPQVVTILKQMPPSTAPDEQPLVACAATAAAPADAGRTETAAWSGAEPVSLRLADVPLTTPLLGSVTATASAAPVAQQAAAALTVSGVGGQGPGVQVPPGFETEVRPGQGPTSPAPIGTAAAQAAARAASAQAVQQAGLAAQQAGAAVAQSQAAAAMASAGAAIGNAIQAARLNDLLQTLTQQPAAPAPVVAPPVPNPGGGAVVAGNGCAGVVGGLCNIAGPGFFGQCTKIGSMSCIVTVSLGGAGLLGQTAVAPSVALQTTVGREQIACTPPVAGAASVTCVGTTRGDVGQNSAIAVTFAPGRVLSGTVATAAVTDLTEPQVRASVNGVLDTTFAARYGPVVIGGRTVQTESYESSYPGPTLRFRPGERLRIRLDNQLPAQSFDGAVQPSHAAGRTTIPAMPGMNHDTLEVNFSNLHIHGMHVSPVGNGDNIFLSINPGQSFQYDYPIPLNQPPGLYWYHPHRHGLTDQQNGFGMMGAMIVEGDLDRIPGIAGLRERLLVIHSTQIAPDGMVVPGDQQSSYIRTINGQINPTIRIQPGETQRWRIANTSADSFVRVKLDGHVMYQIASDGNTWNAPVGQDSIVLEPAARAEVLVRCAAPGTYTFRTLAYFQGFINTPDAPMGTMVCAGPAWTPQPLPNSLSSVVDQRNLTLARPPRLVVFEELQPPLCPANGFCPVIDGRPFDENRVDIQVKLGTTEEWIVRNTSSEEHPFHIHVNPFQVTAVNGNPVGLTGYKDTITLPIGGEVTMRMTFLDFVGKFVIHCHILGHEDAGMMEGGPRPHFYYCYSPVGET